MEISGVRLRGRHVWGLSCLGFGSFGSGDVRSAKSMGWKFISTLTSLKPGILYFTHTNDINRYPFSWLMIPQQLYTSARKAVYEH
jgi:hypothetical protein